MVSDEGHGYGLEVVMGRDAAQSFYWSYHEHGLFSTISLSCCPICQVPAVTFPA